MKHARLVIPGLALIVAFCFFQFAYPYHLMRREQMNLFMFDGDYGKPYFCHIDADGNTAKPFVLPQKSSRFYDYNFRSFNIPDLAKASTGMTPADARRMFNAASEPFKNAE